MVGEGARYGGVERFLVGALRLGVSRLLGAVSSWFLRIDMTR